MWFQLAMLGYGLYKNEEEKKKAKKQEKKARIAADLERRQELAVSRENLLSDMRTASDRSLSEVLKDYQFAEPQPTVYRLGPAKESTFVEQVNIFVEQFIKQIVTTLRL